MFYDIISQVGAGRDGWVSRQGQSQYVPQTSSDSCSGPYSSCPTSNRSCDARSYVQTNTGALIRPACYGSRNPGSWATAPRRPSAPRRNWSCGFNVNTREMFGGDGGILRIESEEGGGVGGSGWGMCWRQKCGGGQAAPCNHCKGISHVHIFPMRWV